MADLLEQGVSWLDGQIHAHAARTVTYRRGADSVQMAATIGRTPFEQVDESGFVHKVESRDFLLRTSDLVLGGAQVLPAEGDRVEEIDGSDTHTYEVMSPGDEPPWRYSDPYRKRLRVHTKLVKTE